MLCGLYCCQDYVHHVLPYFSMMFAPSPYHSSKFALRNMRFQCNKHQCSKFSKTNYHLAYLQTGMNTVSRNHKTQSFCPNSRGACWGISQIQGRLTLIQQNRRNFGWSVDFLPAQYTGAAIDSKRKRCTVLNCNYLSRGCTLTHVFSIAVFQSRGGTALTCHVTSG